MDYLRYPLLGLTILFILFGSLFVLNLLDPYSSFGRIFSDMVRPGLIVVNNWIAGLFERFNLYSVYPGKSRAFYLEHGIYTRSVIGPHYLAVSLFWQALL